MKFNIGNENCEKYFNKKIFFRLTQKEKEVYLKLKRKIPVENIIVNIGETFSNTNYKSINKSEMVDILLNARSNAIGWERKLDTAEDVLTSIKKTNANPKMIAKMFFANPKTGKIEKPFWELTRTMYSIIGIKYFTITKEDVMWLNCLNLKNKYASEVEIIEPLFHILDTKEGHEFIEHLCECKNTICDCIDGRKKLNELIYKIKEYKEEIEYEFEIYNTLIKENPDVVLGLIDKSMDIYFITKLFYIIKKGKTILNKNTTIKEQSTQIEKNEEKNKEQKRD